MEEKTEAVKGEETTIGLIQLTTMQSVNDVQAEAGDR